MDLRPLDATPSDAERDAVDALLGPARPDPHAAYAVLRTAPPAAGFFARCEQAALHRLPALSTTRSGGCPERPP